MTNRRFGIISRLGNLIIVQVLFIFVALALILFVPEGDPQREQDVARDSIEYVGKLFIANDAENGIEVPAAFQDTVTIRGREWRVLAYQPGQPGHWELPVRSIESRRTPAGRGGRE